MPPPAQALGEGMNGYRPIVELMNTNFGIYGIAEMSSAGNTCQSPNPLLRFLSLPPSHPQSSATFASVLAALVYTLGSQQLTLSKFPQNAPSLRCYPSSCVVFRYATTGGQFEMPMTIIGAGGTAPNQARSTPLSFPSLT